MLRTLRTFALEIDGLLRGADTAVEGRARALTPAPTPRLLPGIAALGAIYGLFMGLFALLAERPAGIPWRHGVYQMAASALKVPLLFVATLAVTFPSLYVLSALAGSRLRPPATLKLILCSLAVHLAVLASLGPITGFFTLCTDSYPFMKLLNVLVFALGGVASLHFLRRTLLVAFAHEADAGDDAEATPASRPRASSRSTSSRVFVLWCAIYGAVGAQMGWVLRPFVGSPQLPFELFRSRQSHFFENVLESLRDLFL